jgi:hypothetical protein
MSTDLRDLLAERIGTAPVATGDLEAARSTGRRIRRRRRAATGVAVAAAVVAVGSAVVAVEGGSGPGERTAPDRGEIASSLGALDFSSGARAFGGGNGEFVYLGGRKLPASELEWLDTDAAVTSYGIVFYDAGRPMLLDEAGRFSPLVVGPLDDAESFHPTAKYDGRAPLVAWATRRDGQATITVHDLASGADVASVEPDCGRCGELVIDGLDRGVVFVRTGAGTRTWDSATGEWADFAGPDTRVADVHNGVVLYDGPAPTHPGDWRVVAGAIDAQLTFDGTHLLYWSSTLEPTTPDGQPVLLEKGPADGQGYGQWTFDTDGSVLVAVEEQRRDVVYDCVLPSGRCERVQELETGGDVTFIGNDM